MVDKVPYLMLWPTVLDPEWPPQSTCHKVRDEGKSLASQRQAQRPANLFLVFIIISSCRYDIAYSFEYTSMSKIIFSLYIMIRFFF